MSADRDAQVLTRLLWRAYAPDERRRGPRQSLTVDEIISTAITLADRDGLDGLSFRTVSGALGVRPMSLYTYLPSKDALVSLMVDAVAAEDRPFESGTPLRVRMKHIVEALRREMIRHPWLLEVSSWRQVTGPHRLRRYERQLQQLVDAELTDIDIDHVISLLTAFAVGNARQTLDASRASVSTGLTDSQWWGAVSPVLAEVVPAGEFPLSGRVGSHVGELNQAPGDPSGAFVFGLERLLDGVEAHVRRISGGSGRNIDTVEP